MLGENGFFQFDVRIGEVEANLMGACKPRPGQAHRVSA